MILKLSLQGNIDLADALGIRRNKGGGRERPEQFKAARLLWLSDHLSTESICTVQAVLDQQTTCRPQAHD